MGMVVVKCGFIVSRRRYFMANKLDENDAFIVEGILLLCAEICGCTMWFHDFFIVTLWVVGWMYSMYYEYC